ncbi:MAG: hypothetical protein A2284_09465 [Deltaproteobacteria bacterium RIFOXYA12_FULL_61_11]|nr:MAG: hypothetical protein A2284_09465 [Deltaproteobacteria bacterium RIFOXYA12_FULL_61_11]
MPNDFSSIAAWLQATGPYGFVAVLGWAFWRVSERKDRELKTLYERILSMAEVQTAAVVKVESALVALKEAIEELREAGGRSSQA